MSDEWTIRVCGCGFPLGATLAAIKLVKCPDCGKPVVPVEDRTRRVTVREDEPDEGEGMGTAPDPPPLPPLVKWLALWVFGAALNCVAVALAGPWAVVATFGGIFIAVSVYGATSAYEVRRR